MAVELPRKRKGNRERKRSETSTQEGPDIELDDDDLIRFEEDDQQVRLKCSREPHSQIEKRRRDKMNNLIDELSAMIPSCHGRKMNKLTVLRKAVQYLKTLSGPAGVLTDATYKSSILPYDELRQLLLKAADGFLLVISCDRGKILFISESISKVLNFSQLDLTGQSLFDFIHQKDINKVKEQLVTSELYPRYCADTAAPSQSDSAPRPHLLNSGARRAFFCRMKHSPVAGTLEDQRLLPKYSKKKDASKYCTLHCTGYMHSWPSSLLENADSDTETETTDLSCLVTVCRPLPHSAYKPSKDPNVMPPEFVTRCAIDGRFTFVDQRAMPVIGYLPQEILGTSCYEYFHQADLRHLSEKHRQALRSQDKIDTSCYRFKTKYGPYISLKSQWFSFRNPWTKEVEFIVSLNKVVKRPGQTSFEEASSLKPLPDDTKQLPVIPGLCSGVGTMIYAGSIGTQIANELIDCNSSASSGPSSPFIMAQDKGPVVSSHTSTSMSSREEMPGCSSKSQSDSGTAAGPSGPALSASENKDVPSELDLDSVVVPGLSSFSSDEAAIAVIMSMLETDVNMGASDDIEELDWHTDF
ncbi:basic helix-loop-helix ARNT-like protein 1 isoform X2 [Nelusetta ayraudi]